MLSTRLSELFGCKHPIIRGGMQRIDRARPVSIAASAGAPGLLTALAPAPARVAA